MLVLIYNKNEVNNRMNKLCTKQLQKQDKASQKVYKMLDCTTLALDMCRFLDVEDTSTFSRDLIRDEFIDKIIHYRKNMELLHNREVQETGVGFKSYIKILKLKKLKSALKNIKIQIAIIALFR